MRTGLDLRRVEAVVLTDRRPGQAPDTGRPEGQHSDIIRRTLYSVYMHSRAESDIYMCEPGRAPAPRDALSLVSLVNTGRVRDRVQCVIQYYESVCS